MDNFTSFDIGSIVAEIAEVAVEDGSQRQARGGRD
jgi:hypothetical protein